METSRDTFVSDIQIEIEENSEYHSIAEYNNTQEMADYGNGMFLKLRDYDDIRLNENYTEFGK